MVVTTIYVTRHGFRGTWTVDPKTGLYSTNSPSPTGIASDPPLAAYGVCQAKQLATALSEVDQPAISRIYSSPFYRCLQTLQPFAEASRLEVRGDHGLGEWYGRAPFTHPSPAGPGLLHALFPWYAINYRPGITPSPSGETISQLHKRCEIALRHIITQADAEDAARIAELSAEESVGKKRSSDETAILICTHAAPLIAIGRALTGEMPVDMCQQDFKTNTCGISKFKRRTLSVSQSDSELPLEKVELPITSTAGLRYSKGIVGGWDCVMNSDGAHLEGGEERGWHFHGDEAFDDSGKAIDSKL